MSGRVEMKEKVPRISDAAPIITTAVTAALASSRIKLPNSSSQGTDGVDFGASDFGNDREGESKEGVTSWERSGTVKFENTFGLIDAVSGNDLATKGEGPQSVQPSSAHGAA
jgi:hypothetical protein